MRTSPHARAMFTMAGLGIAVVVALAACSNAATSAPAGDTSIDPTRSVAGGFAAAASAALPESGSNADQGLPAASGEPANPADPALAVTDADIVRTGSISIEVPKIDPALDAVRTAIVGLGGYVSDSDQSNSPDQETASVTYRVPVDSLAGRARRGRQARREGRFGQVERGRGDRPGPRPGRPDRQSAGRPNGPSRRSWRQATKISDVLAVESQLSDVQGQIEAADDAAEPPQGPGRPGDADRRLRPAPDPGRGRDVAWLGPRRPARPGRSAALLGIGQALASGRDLADRGRPAGGPCSP